MTNCCFIVKFIAIFTISILIISCQRNVETKNKSFEIVNDPLMVPCTTASVKLCWDKSTSSRDSISSYQLSYRPHGTEKWILLRDSISADTSCVKIFRNEIKESGPLFDFGVSVLSITGTVSSLHSSLATDSKPANGWFLNWIYKSQ